MNRKLGCTLVFSLLAAGLTPAAWGEPGSPAEAAKGASAPTTAALDSRAIAAKLVNDCARIKEGEAVLISGGNKHFDLLEAIAIDVRKQGAFPLLSVGSEKLIRQGWDAVPARYDSQTDKLGLKLAETVAASIDIDYVETQGLASRVPAERRAARAKAGIPVGEAFRKNNVRQVNLGNGLYPTEERARQLGMTRSQLETLFWQGVNTDYPRLQARGEAVRAALAAGKELHLTNPNGTDLKVRIEGRPVLVSDGVISDEDARRGGPACSVWLPAGEVYLAPVAGTAEGKVVVDRLFYQGQAISGLTLTFKAGKLQSMSARSGIEPLQAYYDAAGPGKDAFAVIDLGINSDVVAPAGSTFQAWMPAGMVTVGVGGNTWAGGDVETNFDLSAHVPGSTVTVDGKPVVEGGKLKL